MRTWLSPRGWEALSIQIRSAHCMCLSRLHSRITITHTFLWYRGGHGFNRADPAFAFVLIVVAVFSVVSVGRSRIKHCALTRPRRKDGREGTERRRIRVCIITRFTNLIPSLDPSPYATSTADTAPPPPSLPPSLSLLISSHPPLTSTITQWIRSRRFVSRHIP
jgi:hypothetical protein